MYVYVYFVLFLVDSYVERTVDANHMDFGKHCDIMYSSYSYT